MHTDSTKDDTGIPLPEISNLYLVLLRFRFPPINIIQEAPNTSTYIPFHADSLLLFADIVKNYGNNDWRYDFVKASLFRKFESDCPESIHCSKKFGVPLSSILIPVLRRKDNKLELFLSTRHPRALSAIVDRGSVELGTQYRVEGLFRQEKLWIRKRDDIVKLSLISTEFLNIKKVVSGISAGSGGYRAIDLSVKVPIEYLSIELAFFASINDYGKLVEELNILKRTGIGKKRDMGLGDLVSWEAYRVRFNGHEIRVLEPMILFCKDKERNEFIIITLRNLPAAIVNELRQRHRLLVISMKAALSRTRPPYWVREELCLMPFSEFLLR